MGFAMKVRVFVIALVMIFSFAAAAMAQSIQEEGTPAVGAHGLYTFLPGAFISPAYSDYTSISAIGYGGWATYGLGAFDLSFQLNNWNLMVEDGYWKPRGGDLEDKFYVESTLGMVDFNMAVIWKWRVHRAVEPYVGPGLGIGWLYGDLEVDEVDEDGKRLHDPEDKELPPVIPYLSVLTGCRFYPDPHWRLSIDTGFYFGFFIGASVGYVF